MDILTPLQKLPKNVGDLGKLIVAKGLKKLPKVQKNAQSGYPGRRIGKARQKRFTTQTSLITFLTFLCNFLFQKNS